MPSRSLFLPGNNFEFHGQIYSSVWVADNGFISFGASPSVTNGGFSIDTLSWRDAEPSIAVALADWSWAAGGPNDGIVFEEIGLGNTLRIAWGDPLGATGSGISHFGDTDSNRFEVLLQMTGGLVPNPAAGTFEVDVLALDPFALTQPGDGVIGHTPGGATLLGGLADVDLHATQVSGPDEAQFEEHDATGGNASVAGYDGSGGRRAYSNLRSWGGGEISFTPGPAPIAGATGYASNAPVQAPR